VVIEGYRNSVKEKNITDGKCEIVMESWSVGWLSDREVSAKFSVQGRRRSKKRAVKSKKKLMNIEHRTSNIEHRIMYSVFFYKDRATRGASACAARAKPQIFNFQYSFAAYRVPVCLAAHILSLKNDKIPESTRRNHHYPAPVL